MQEGPPRGAFLLALMTHFYAGRRCIFTPALTLVEREIGYNLQGRSEIEFEPGGLTVTLAFPLTEIVDS